jgi:hypothetical protein
MEGITEAQLAELKAKHGAVFLIIFNPKNIQLVNVDDAEDVLEWEQNPDYEPDYPTIDFVFKRLKDMDVLAASAAMAQENPLKSLKMQMDATLVWGDKELLKDPIVLTSISGDFGKINKPLTSKLKKI